jgi:hypothetical protein
MIQNWESNQSISYHNSQKGGTDNTKTDRPTPHFRVQHTLSSPLQVEKQISHPNSQSVKTPTANGDRVLSARWVTSVSSLVIWFSLIFNSLSFSDIEVCSMSISFCKLSMIVWFGVGVLAAFSVVFVFCVIPICVEGKTESCKDQIW